MGEESRDWIVYVAWETIAAWKRATRSAADAWGSTEPKPPGERAELDDYPYQYASRQARFMKMRGGDRLWLVSLPQFQGFCQAPSIMASLELVGVYDRMLGCPVEVSRHSDSFGRYLAVGKPGKTIDTYPPLYNVFDVLLDAQFKGGVEDLRKYVTWLEQGDFGSEGPYYRLAQHFRTLRQLKPASGARLRERHRIAINGHRAFISYKTGDLGDGGETAPDVEGRWTQRLVESLEKARVLIWWDRQQLVGRRGAWDQQAELVRALLDDGVQQATWFIALGTQRYGLPGYSGRRWTLEEWEAAGAEAVNRRRRGELRRLLVEFGDSGAAARLPGEADVTVSVAADVGAQETAAVIANIIRAEEEEAR